MKSLTKLGLFVLLCLTVTPSLTVANCLQGPFQGRPAQPIAQTALPAVDTLNRRHRQIKPDSLAKRKAVSRIDTVHRR